MCPNDSCGMLVGAAEKWRVPDILASAAEPVPDYFASRESIRFSHLE